MSSNNQNTLVADTHLFTLDIAVVQSTYSSMNLKNMLDHVVNLDIIDIDEATFKSLFFASSGNFSISPTSYLQPELIKYISFCAPYRTIDNNNFCNTLFTLF